MTSNTATKLKSKEKILKMIKHEFIKMLQITVFGKKTEFPLALFGETEIVSLFNC